jgi:uncharacterized protein
MAKIHLLDPADLPRALVLNNAHATELSRLDAERLAELAGRAFLGRRIGSIDAFLLAFDQDADYDSPNFLWFKSRYARFVYVDRIVVAPAARGHGHARRLYGDLFDQARRAGHERIVCEVNVDPPTRCPTPSTRRWASRKSAAAKSTKERRLSGISCVHCGASCAPSTNP